ncbi:MAG: fibronectin type III domain-containing protein, partial [Planctomycetes bacterium]|nr:fibronectin type III domain-containing protein [Planctomycetota bacterium]
PPPAPSGLLATAASSEQVTLSWTDNSSNAGGFSIERKTGTAGSYQVVGTVGATPTSYEDAGLQPSTQYVYRVLATSSAGDSTYSGEASATTQAPPLLPPSDPSGLGAVSTSFTQTNLTWTDTSNDETGFKIERKLGVAGIYAEVAQIGPNLTSSGSYTDSGLSDSSVYYYRVSAFNSAGNSAPSNDAAATTLSPTTDAWDSGVLNGWVGNTAWTTVTAPGTGGNPAGYLRAVGTNGWSGAFNLGSAYTGDLATIGVRRANIDVKCFTGTFSAAYLRVRYRDSTFNGWRYLLTGSPLVGTWQSFQVNFDPSWSDAEAIAAGWTQEATSPSFSATMGDVYSMEIRLTGSGEVGLDNFQLGP